MSILRRRSPSSAAAPPPAEAPPLEDDDLLSEILLRLSSEPSSLPRASAVCMRWFRLITDPRFVCRFRRHHRRNPPLLGFSDTHYGPTFQSTLDAPNRVPPGRFSLQRDDGDGDRFITLACRHGLVLVLYPEGKKVLVWDPVTTDQHLIALPPLVNAVGSLTKWAVLRAAGDIHHFQVVILVPGKQEEVPRGVWACVYSSETGRWGNLISTLLSPQAGMAIFYANVLSRMPAVLVGDSLYWTLAGNYAGILEFDLKKQSLAVIQVPAGMSEHDKELTVMRAEGGGLGFLFVSEVLFHAQLWKREIDCDGVSSWVVGKTIELDKLLSLDSKKDRWPLRIRGFAENNNVVLLSAVNSLFMVELESLQFKKLFATNIYAFRHPFESVYAAETSNGGGHDGAEVLHNA